MSGGDWKEMFNAAVAGELELLAFHVRAGVDVNYAHPEFLSTPLVAAILARQSVAALFLLDHGAEPTLGSEFDGLTPMQAAQSVGLSDVRARLIALGVPPPAPMAAPPRTGWLRRWWPARSAQPTDPA